MIPSKVQNLIKLSKAHNVNDISPELFSEFGVSYKKDDQIFQEGDWGFDLYLLLSGEVSIYKQYKGNLELLTKLKKGEIFGEMAIFENNCRSATVIADSFCQLLRWTHFLNPHPDY